MNETRNSNIPQMLPEPTLRRLPWYLAYVTELRKNHTEYVSSTRIAEEINVDSSQIAKDLSFLNIKGKTRIGYEVAMLERELRQFLGFRARHNAVVIGVGSLGAALMQDTGLENYGLNIVAGFDINPDVIGTEINGVPVYHTELLAAKQAELGAKVGIITVPFDCAQQVAEQCIAAKIPGLWNFTPRRIRVPEWVVVQNTSIYSHLAVMYNRLRTLDD